MAMRSESRSAARATLAVEALRQSGHLRLQVWGASMLPSLWPGDVAEVTSCVIEDVQPGQIILAFCDDRFYLHRLQRREESGFITRGDSMPQSDPAFAASALLGKVVRVARSGRLLGDPPRAGKLARGLGRLLCYCGPARQVALRLHGIRSPQYGEFTAVPSAQAGGIL